MTDGTQKIVFFVSDGTGITAETLGGTLLTQFEDVEFKKITLPFINTPDKARVSLNYINHVAATETRRPIVFSTTVNEEVRAILRSANAMFLDLFDTYIAPVEAELGVKSSHAQGRAHGMSDHGRYNARIDAMNFAMEHDDGQSVRDIGRADVVLIAPSRCGKTPTTLYLALQHAVFATNFPLTEDDLENLKLPKALRGHESKLFGLTSDPERLQQVRSERRPGSKYASLAQCAYELRQAEQLYRRHNIPQLNSASMSIEEIAAMVMQEKNLRR
ncbi:pyruvate, water dikinase regulatory protein [Nevskia sp.]|uniref:posphoenolpyruvate synthetase regulatory kinase/phosphorylase PpsR n=1 Tax=Nevskia sp. TaxID=1929292 RepID=UPI0025D4BF45|nr:pyruvate, water dikinase regulatory protein [Nevskia sp.]HET7796287.1 pyruvate, water dikinase regulatory protein [Nevskia sp.]